MTTPNADDLATTFEEYRAPSGVYTIRNGDGGRVGSLVFDATGHPYDAARMRLWEQAPAMWQCLQDLVTVVRTATGDGRQYEELMAILSAVEGEK